ncbi:MAG: hypothetical protein JWO80_6229 [Bryobacterales bacterium]|nr:hypothetical protein [Bryobacterales bacterium]
MTKVSKWAALQPVQGKISYVFDECQHFAEIARLTDFRLSDPRMRELFQFHSMSKADDEQVTPLQAADMLSYEIAKCYKDGDRREARISGARLYLEMPHAWEEFSESKFFRYVKTIELGVPDDFDFV